MSDDDGEVIFQGYVGVSEVKSEFHGTHGGGYVESEITMHGTYDLDQGGQDRFVFLTRDKSILRVIEPELYGAQRIRVTIELLDEG